jgi:V8-like Glu-specific endopeptidase
MGHPGGRDLEFSLHDNRLLACSASHAHYRTPTEGGSSGSPVFDSDGWEAVALHHAGSDAMPRLDDPRATYRANEGILVAALQRAAMAGDAVRG